MQEQLYKKVKNRYLPVNDPYAYEGLSEGTWVVVVKPGQRSMRIQTCSDFSRLDAALLEFEDHLSHAIRKASELRPQQRKVSEKEQKAWAAYKRVMGDDMPFVVGEYPSCQEIAQNAIASLKQRISKTVDF